MLAQRLLVRPTLAVRLAVAAAMSGTLIVGGSTALQ